MVVKALQMSTHNLKIYEHILKLSPNIHNIQSTAVSGKAQLKLCNSYSGLNLNICSLSLSEEFWLKLCQHFDSQV